MDTAGLHRFDIVEIYNKYCDIVSGRGHVCTKGLLSMLSKSVDSRARIRDTVFSDISKLLSFLDVSEDSRQFNCFYNFVFFICRENGQKNITVQKAVTAWRIVLNGRFRLLNQWCNFVEKHQKHNISEDTWQQLLAFSRCVNEDLEGYDPKGAWPVLIDDFVDYMYRTNQSNEGRAKYSVCCCCEMEAQCSISNTFSGLNLLSGSKRKPPADINGCEGDSELGESPMNQVSLLQLKRPKQSCAAANCGFWGSSSGANLLGGSTNCHEMNNNCSRGCLQTSACAVDRSSTDFEGYHSIGCFQFDQKTGGSFT